MRGRSYVFAFALGCAVTAPAWAQNSAPALSPALRASMMSDDDPAPMSPEAIAAILLPAQDGAASRAIKAGGDVPTAGTPGSGVIPDLKIEFTSGSAQVGKQSVHQLGALVLAMNFPRLRDVRLLIAGHTDARGDARANQILSQKRAEAVVNWLIRSGSISPARLEAVGYGEDHLADPANPTSARNRRVEVRIEETLATAKEGWVNSPRAPNAT